jgi:putative flavoprotein involved in K+ transport
MLEKRRKTAAGTAPTHGHRVEAAVVGAGAAGLWAAAELRRRGVRVVVLERSDSVAASWRRRYDGLRLNTVRWMSGLPGTPIPRRAGKWPTREDFVDYLDSFAARHELEVRFGVEVSRIDRAGEEWRLDTTQGPLQVRFVVVATGYDGVATIPEWPGRKSFAGELIHASEYRNPDRFRGKDVLVVGVGNSGTEIATQLANCAAARVLVSMRTPVNILPRELLGVPITVFARVSERQPAWVGDRLGFLVQRLAWGDLSAYGMPRAPHGVSPELRVRGLGAVVDGGFVAALKQGRMELVPAVESFDGQEVVLAGGARRCPEVVIAATGYRHGLEALVGHLGVLLSSGKPAVLGARTHPNAPRLYFNGFWLPASGQLPAMRRTSRRIARAVSRDRLREAAGRHAVGRWFGQSGRQHLVGVRS